MPVSRASFAAAIVAPLLAAAGCASAGGSPCSYCDGGKSDRQADRADDPPAAEAFASDATGEPVANLAEAGEAPAAASRDTAAGERPLLTPIPDAGYLLDDDFETGSAPGWEVLGGEDRDASSADWSVILGTSGSVFAQGILDEGRWHIAFTTASLGPDQIIEAKLRVVDFFAPAPSDLAALFGRYDASSDSGYYVALRGDGSLIVRRRDHGASASWAAGVDAGIRAGVWYTVRLEVIGATINAFLDGKPVYSVTDADPLPGGGIALGTLGATLEVDRVAVALPY